MVESEAKTIIERDLNCLKQNKALPDSIEAMEIAINALEKQMKLNEMGDCYIIPKDGVFEVNCVDVNLAIQKQIAKKPKEKDCIGFNTLVCPVCKGTLYLYEPYCDNCGQAIDWSDEE